MKKYYFRWLSVISIAAFCMSFVSCGGGDDDSPLTSGITENPSDSNSNPNPNTNSDIPISVSYTDKGYYDGLLYYKIQSNETMEAAVAEVESTVTTVIIPKYIKFDDRIFRVTSIGEKAFRNCKSLTSVTIGNNVKSIGNYAFSDCYSLKEVHILDLDAWCKISFSSNSSNPLCYAHHLFMDGKEVKDLVIPNNVTTIESGVFYGCDGFTSVKIPNSVTSIGGGAFSNCI